MASGTQARIDSVRIEHLNTRCVYEVGASSVRYEANGEAVVRHA